MRSSDHAVPCTEVRGHLILCCGPCSTQATSGLSIGKSSSQITPRVNTFYYGVNTRELLGKNSADKYIFPLYPPTLPLHQQVTEFNP